MLGPKTYQDLGILLPSPQYLIEPNPYIIKAALMSEYLKSHIR